MVGTLGSRGLSNTNLVRHAGIGFATGIHYPLNVSTDKRPSSDGSMAAEKPTYRYLSWFTRRYLRVAQSSVVQLRQCGCS